MIRCIYEIKLNKTTILSLELRKTKNESNHLTKEKTTTTTRTNQLRDFIKMKHSHKPDEITYSFLHSQKKFEKIPSKLLLAIVVVMFHLNATANKTNKKGK